MGVSHRFTPSFFSLIRRHFSDNKPVKWLEEATTYADVQAAFTDPFTSLPYPEKDLRRIIVEPPATVNSRRKQRPITSQSPSQLPIEKQVVVMFPGQGAQYVGMGQRLNKCSASIEVYNRSSEILGYDILKLCLSGPKSKLDQTIYCQPAIFTTCLAAWAKAQVEDETLLDRVTDVAGFSIGEFAAFVLADVLTFEDALKLVKLRAEAMHDCSQKVPSGMLTVRVSASTRLEEALNDAKTYAWENAESPICEIANYLVCGIKVIGASKSCMEFLEHSQEKYAFEIIKRLKVSGAFHTSLMNDAVFRMRDALKEISFKQPSVKIYSNYTGKCHSSNNKLMREAVVKQICSPVKWEQILQLLHAKHQNYKFPTFMEIGPGKQLGAMLMRVSKKAYQNYVNIVV